MFNQYIFEKKLKQKALEKLNSEKNKKIQKIRLKRREELSKKYYEKVNNFMLNMIDKPIIISDNNNSLLIPKSNKNEKKLSDINKIKYFNSNEISKQNLLNSKKYLRKTINNEDRQMIENNHWNIINKNINDNDNNNNFNQPFMKFKPRNDFERILDTLYSNRGNHARDILINSDEKNIQTLQVNENESKILKNIDSKNNSTNNIFFNNSINTSFLYKNNAKMIKANNKIKNNSVKNKLLAFKPVDKFLSNKINNSKLLKKITKNYHSKSYFKGLEFSILTQKNKNKIKNYKNMKNKMNKTGYIYKLKKNDQLGNNSYYFNNYFTPKNKNSESVNSLNFYYNDVKRFQKSAQRLILENAINDSYEQSSDSSINDNGQEEIFKKVILLNHPILGESKKIKNISLSNYKYYKNLNYLKNLSERNNNKNIPKMRILKNYKFINDEIKKEIIMDGANYIKIKDTLYKKDDINNIGNYVLKKCNVIRSKYNGKKND